MKTVMIVAGESSGELYGSLLAKALKARLPDVHMLGVGGEKMKDAGVDLIASTSDAFGLIEAVSAYRQVKTAFKKAVEAIEKFKPEVLILIDYPDFNIRLARVARAAGIKILYYVSPQVWAWRKGRIKQIAEIVDRIAVILPFEENIYREAGVKCEFVGHPILEEIKSVLQTASSRQHPELRAHFKTILGFDPRMPLLSLLPGSRPSELKRLLPLMLDVVRQFKTEVKESADKYQICIPLAPNTEESKYADYLNKLRHEGVEIKKGESVRVLAASDIAVVASGTATLQTALIEVPMVVVYKLSPLTYVLGKLIVNVKYISLVNILAGREVVKELIQKRANPEEIIKEIKRIIFDMKYKEEILNNYRLIKKPFLDKRTSERVAEMVIEMASR
ncbi:MAG: lipid-A-disaccharide synthase [Nitrospirota bacterium]